ncbi:MAG: RDD family protein [Clostridiales bacterium]|jgi:uncharacterized RDD family membrane protein YckC|nr:RDD family protein [Clostridiales bacterium]
MKYISIITPDNVEIQYRLANVASRFAAAFVDLLVQMAAIGILFLIFYAELKNSLFSLDAGTIAALALLGFFVVYFGYCIILELALNGQTLGKKLFGLRVLRDNGMPIGFVNSLVRNLFKLIIDINGPAAFCIFFNKRAKRVGDMVASTVVVCERDARDITKIPAAVDESSAGLHTNFFLSDEEYYMVSEYFSRRAEFLDGGEKLGGKIRAYLINKFNANNGTLTDHDMYNIMMMNRR